MDSKEPTQDEEHPLGAIAPPRNSKTEPNVESVLLSEQESAPDCDEVPQSIKDLLLEKYGSKSPFELPVKKRQYLTNENPQFSIIELMMITSICFLILILVSKTGFFAAVGLFVVFFIGGQVANYRFEDPTSLRFWNQLIWGALMPAVCFFADPFVFGSFEMGRPTGFNPYAFACYSFVGWQVIMLAVSWFVPSGQNALNAFVAGTLFAGGAFSGIVAVCLMPLAMLATIYLVGLPGFTPLLTSNVYFRTSSMHRRRAGHSTAMDIAFVLGIGTACGFFGIGYGLMILLEPQMENMFNGPSF